MKLMGFNFNKINIERFSSQVQKINIKTNINISKINKVKSDVLKLKETLLNIDFKYNIDYEENYAKIEFSGNILVAIDNELGEKTIKEWEEKKIPEKFKIDLFNLILRKCDVKALELEDEFNLPLHVSMPKVQQNN